MKPDCIIMIILMVVILCPSDMWAHCTSFLLAGLSSELTPVYVGHPSSEVIMYMRDSNSPSISRACAIGWHAFMGMCNIYGLI